MRRTPSEWEPPGMGVESSTHSSPRAFITHQIFVHQCPCWVLGWGCRSADESGTFPLEEVPAYGVKPDDGQVVGLPRKRFQRLCVNADLSDCGAAPPRGGPTVTSPGGCLLCTWLGRRWHPPPLSRQPRNEVPRPLPTAGRLGTVVLLGGPGTQPHSTAIKGRVRPGDNQEWLSLLSSRF